MLQRAKKRNQRQVKRLQINNDDFTDNTPSSTNDTSYKLAGARKSRKYRESLKNDIEKLEEDNKLLSEKNLKLTRRVGMYKKCTQIKNDSKR